MTTVKTQRGEFLFVEYPGVFSLEGGNYSLFVLDSLNIEEQQADKIVDSVRPDGKEIYRDYLRDPKFDKPVKVYYYNSALNSFRSLLDANGLPEDTNYCILRIIK